MYDLIGMETKRDAAPSTFAFRPVGHGVQDFPPILEAAAESGARYVVVEQDAWQGPSLERRVKAACISVRLGGNVLLNR